MMPLRVAAIVAFSLACSQVKACALALVLAVDVSGSVDKKEYDIQMQGLAAALSDGIVVEALVDQKAMVTLLQWTGASRQRQTIAWTKMNAADDVLRFAENVASNDRVWRNYSTAIGEALIVAQDLLSDAEHCTRKVIDVSGDGISNEGVLPRRVHDALQARRIVVNALAIETNDEDLTAWFYENVIVGEGAFVMTANGFKDYPAQIRRKLQRETTRQLSALR